MKILKESWFDEHDILPMQQFGADQFGDFKYEILPGVVIKESFDQKELKKGAYGVAFNIASFYHGISKGSSYYIGNIKVGNVYRTWNALKLIRKIADTTSSSLKNAILADDFECDSFRNKVTKKLDNGSLAFVLWAETYSKPHKFSINLWRYEGIENRNELIKPINDLAEDFARKAGYPPLYQDKEGNRVVIPSIPHPLKDGARKLWEKSRDYRERLENFEEIMKKVLHSPKLIDI